MFSNMNGWMMDGWWTAERRFGLGILMIWSLLWKALALWKAAREDSKPWFGAFLVINTAGLLEIVYLFFFAKEKMTLGSPAAPAKTKAKSKK